MEAAELISRCKAGERQALNLLYQQYKPQLLNICKQYAKEDDVAEDLLHDAFVVIFTSLDRLENADKLEAWMYAIVRNVGYHYRQHADKELAALQQLAKEKLDTTETGHIADYNELKSLVTLLPQGYQQVFRLSVFEGLSHQEISQLLGITPHSSSSQLSHAKRMLRQLIRQSWVLVFLLIAIPAAIWQFLNREEPERQLPVVSKDKPKPQPTPPAEKPDEQPVYVAINKHPSSHPIRYQAETVILPDSIPYQKQEEQMETPTETPLTTEAETKKDTVVYQSLPLPSADELFTTELVSTSHSWNISVAYNGLIGQNDNYLSAAPGLFSNWIDYNYYLNNSPSVLDDAETRSLMNIAAQNSLINSGLMEARYEHKRPITLQVLFNRQLSKLLSIETGLSYTRLASTISTGSSNAYIQEQQRLHYLGIPFRLGWRWYSMAAHLSLYSSAGIMMELPIKSAVDISHIANGINTFQKETSLDVPCQLSGSFGLGLQYDFTPHFGVYLEPSLQYFFDDGSDLKTYRTEHPLQITLPLGIRFRW